MHYVNKKYITYKNHYNDLVMSLLYTDYIILK